MSQSPIIQAVLAASQGLEAGVQADLIVDLTNGARPFLNGGERVALYIRLGTALGIRPPTSSKPAPARGTAKSPIFIREVLEFDPSVFNGYSISKGAFINKLSTYTGTNLLCVGTRGVGDKLLMFGKKAAGVEHKFVYPSGNNGTLADFNCLIECKSWPEAHKYLDSIGIPHGTAQPFGQPIAKAAGT